MIRNRTRAGSPKGSIWLARRGGPTSNSRVCRQGRRPARVTVGRAKLLSSGGGQRAARASTGIIPNRGLSQGTFSFRARGSLSDIDGFDTLGVLKGTEAIMIARDGGQTPEVITMKKDMLGRWCAKRPAFKVPKTPRHVERGAPPSIVLAWRAPNVLRREGWLWCRRPGVQTVLDLVSKEVNERGIELGTERSSVKSGGIP